MATTTRATTMSVFLERQAAQQEAAMKADLEQRQRDIQEAIENELESFYDSESDEADDDDGDDRAANDAANPGGRRVGPHRPSYDNDQLSESSNSDCAHQHEDPGDRRRQRIHQRVDLANQIRPPIEGSSIDDEDHRCPDDDDDAEEDDEDEEAGGEVFAPPPGLLAALPGGAVAPALYPLSLLPADHPARHLILPSEATSRSTAQLATLSPETTGCCGLSSAEYSAVAGLHQHHGNRHLPPDNILPPRPVQRVDVGVSVVPENQRDLDQLDILYRARGRHIEELKAQLQELQDASGRETRLLKHKLALADANRESLEKAKDGAEGKLAAASLQIRELLSESDKRQELSARLLAENEQLHRGLEAASSQNDALSTQLAELNTAGTIGRVRDQQENFIQSLRNKKDEEIYFLRDRIDRLLAEAGERQLELESARAAATQQRAQDSAQLLQANEVTAGLAQQLQESQRRCQDLLASAATEEVTAGLRQQLAQREVAKIITDEMNAALQEEISDLREQLAMYETAERLGVLPTKSPPQTTDTSGVIGGRDATSTSMPIGGPAADKDRGVACLKAELLRCHDLYKQKREKVEELRKQLIQVRNASHEYQLRCDQAEVALAQYKERTAAMEARLRAVQKRLDEATEPGAAEVRLRKQLEAANEHKAILDEELTECKRRLQASLESERQLSAQTAQLREDFASAWERAEREKRDDFDRIQRTCQEHFELCRERMREELLAGFSAEKRQLVDEHERRSAEMQTLVAQLGDERRELEARLTQLPRAPPMLPTVVAAEKRAAGCQTEAATRRDGGGFEAASTALQTPAASLPMDPLAEQETELGRRLQECYLTAISRIREEIVNHMTESQERSERRVVRAQRNVCARFALHLRRSLEEKFGYEDSQLSVDSVVQLLNQSLSHTLNRSLPSASHLRRSAATAVTAASPGNNNNWEIDSVPNSSGHSSPSGVGARAAAAAIGGCHEQPPPQPPWTPRGGGERAPVAPPRPARAAAAVRSSSVAATSTPAEKDPAASAAMKS